MAQPLVWQLEMQIKSMNAIPDAVYSRVGFEFSEWLFNHVVMLLYLKYPKADSCPLWHPQYTSSDRSFSATSPGLGWAHLWICFGTTLFHQWFFFSFSKTRADRNSGDEQSNLCTWKCSSNAVSACLTIKTTKDYNPAFLALLTFYILTHSLILLGRKFSDRVSDLCLFSVNNFTMPKRPFPWWGGPSQR